MKARHAAGRLPAHPSLGPPIGDFHGQAAGGNGPSVRWSTFFPQGQRGSGSVQPGPGNALDLPALALGAAGLGLT
jgi:hypothetical protein